MRFTNAFSQQHPSMSPTDRWKRLRLPVPVSTSYNPVEANAGTAAALWELLRHNPAFRLTAVRVLNIAYGDAAQKMSSENRHYRVEKMMGQLFANTPACFAIGWMICPEYVSYEWPDFGDPDAVHGLCEKLGDDACWQMAVLAPKRTGWKAELQQAIELGRTALEGAPLTCQDRLALVNTNWLGLPPLFRLLFSWLCEEVDPTRAADCPPIPATDYELDPGGPGFLHDGVDWRFLESGGGTLTHQTRFDLIELRHLMENNLVITIPLAPLTETQLTSYLKWINDEVEQRLRKQRLLLGRQSIGNLFGGPADWKHFITCRAKIGYSLSTDSDGALIFTRGNSVEHAYEKHQDDLRKDGTITPSSNFKPRIKACYEKLEELMKSVFPVFDWSRIVRSRPNAEKLWAVRYQDRLRTTMRTKFELIAHCKPSDA
ncbi:MAG: hypothetical protein RL077_649 [Verrucomicrobiota bacterium]|jgi:hypothetical protein